MKSKLFTLGLVVFLSALLCTINGLDAPEYARCNHIGVCEFLEICANLGHNLGDTYIYIISMMLTAMDQSGIELIHSLIHHNLILVSNHTLLLSLLATIDQPVQELIHNFIHYKEAGIQHLAWPNLGWEGHVMVRYINNSTQKVLLLPPGEGSKFSIQPNSQLTLPSGINSLPSEALKFITTSVIRS